MAILTAAILDSKYRIDIVEYEIYSGRLPESFDGFRIVQVSDLHSRMFGKNNAGLFTAVELQAPDLIALTGDFIENAEDLTEFRELLVGLTGIAPTYFVSGNHDWASGEIENIADLLECCGVKYLRNEYLEITRDEESIILCGIEDPNGYADMKKPTEVVGSLREPYPKNFTVLLGHRNYWLEQYPALDVDVILCGHCHGGLIRLPLIGGLIGTNLKLFPRYTNGPYEGERYVMVVSRGLGNSVPVPRMLNNAHLPVVVLRAGE